MPPKQPKDAIIIVLDIGRSVSTLHEFEDETFFSSAKNCVSWIIQRKIISESSDVLSLLLIGSEHSDNPIATTGYENISVKFDFQLASWDLLKFIESEVKTTNLESDWFGALIVALEMLKAYEEYNTVNNKKIVIFSDFTKHASDDINRIVKIIKTLNIEITIIGPDHLDFSTEYGDEGEPEIKRRKAEKDVKRQEGEKIVYELWKKLPENIWICTFESALKQLCSYMPKAKRINYWNCILDIGDVNINVSVIKKTDPKPAKKFNIKCLKPNDDEPSQGTSLREGMVKTEETSSTVRDTVMHYKHETGQSSEIVDVEVRPEDTIEGYRYGTTIIPFSEEDKSAMQYKSGPKSFSVIGFTHQSKVPYYLLSGECAYLVLPRNKDRNAEVALSAIIQGMKKTECLAIARRVYSDNWGLSLGIFYPVVEEIVSDDPDEISHREYLLFVELAFADDIKSISFPSLEKFAKDITQQQFDAVDDLIDGMNLMKADKGLRGEQCEAFDLPFLHDFKEQFFHYCVIQRGLYPDKPLPTSLPPYIENFIKTPKSIEENCASVFENIKKEFKIKMSSAEKAEGNKKEGKQSEKRAEHFDESTINEEKDSFNRTWMKIFAKGFPSNEDLDKISGTFDELNESEKSQLLDSFGVVLTRIHRMYLKCYPDEYNWWLNGLKTYLKGKPGLETGIWERVIAHCVGLISTKENKYSKVSEEEAEEFLCSVFKKPDSSEKEVPEYELLDELQAEQMDVDFDCS